MTINPANERNVQIPIASESANCRASSAATTPTSRSVAGASRLCGSTCPQTAFVAGSTRPYCARRKLGSKAESEVVVDARDPVDGHVQAPRRPDQHYGSDGDSERPQRLRPARYEYRDRDCNEGGEDEQRALVLDQAGGARTDGADGEDPAIAIERETEQGDERAGRDDRDRYVRVPRERAVDEPRLEREEQHREGRDLQWDPPVTEADHRPQRGPDEDDELQVRHARIPAALHRERLERRLEDRVVEVDDVERVVLEDPRVGCAEHREVVRLRPPDRPGVPVDHRLDSCSGGDVGELHGGDRDRHGCDERGRPAREQRIGGARACVATRTRRWLSSARSMTASAVSEIGTPTSARCASMMPPTSMPTSSATPPRTTSSTRDRMRPIATSAPMPPRRFIASMTSSQSRCP